MRVTERVAIVTEGLSGIGSAVVARLSRDGMIVVAADITTPSIALDPTPGVHPFRVDVTDQASVAALVRAVMAASGRVDCLVHCAGIGRVLPFLETSWRRSTSWSGRICTGPSSSGRPAPA